MKIPTPTYIYHFTHIDNFEGIIYEEAILSKRRMERENIYYTSAAYNTLQERRSVFNVPVEPYGTIHDYVPFYFTSLTPMLYAIKTGNLEGIKMRDLIILQSTAQTVENNNKKYAFTDGHGIMVLSDFYNELDDLDNINWKAIKATYWNDFPDGKRLRQAEFLVYESFEWHHIRKIGVYSQSMGTRVQSLLSGMKHKPNINVKRNWYF